MKKVTKINELSELKTIRKNLEYDLKQSEEALEQKNGQLNHLKQILGIGYQDSILDAVIDLKTYKKLNQGAINEGREMAREFKTIIKMIIRPEILDNETPPEAPYELGKRW